METSYLLHKIKAQDTSQNVWLITFQDMLSLLLSFFILLFSMGEIKKQSLETLYPKKRHPYESAGSPELQPKEIGKYTASFQPALHLNYLVNILKEKTKAIPLLKETFLIPYKNRVILSLPGDLVFATARASLTEEAQKALYLLAEGLRSIPNRIHIYGYTDPRPIKGGPYISNWELSLARALAVEKSLKDGGYDRPILTQGFSDTHPAFLEYLEQLKTEKQNYTFLRRVDIVIFETGQRNLLGDAS